MSNCSNVLLIQEGQQMMNQPKMALHILSHCWNLLMKEQPRVEKYAWAMNRRLPDVFCWRFRLGTPSVRCLLSEVAFRCECNLSQPGWTITSRTKLVLNNSTPSWWDSASTCLPPSSPKPHSRHYFRSSTVPLGSSGILHIIYILVITVQSLQPSFCSKPQPETGWKWEFFKIQYCVSLSFVHVI